MSDEAQAVCEPLALLARPKTQAPAILQPTTIATGLRRTTAAGHAGLTDMCARASKDERRRNNQPDDVDVDDNDCGDDTGGLRHGRQLAV